MEKNDLAAGISPEMLAMIQPRFVAFLKELGNQDIHAKQALFKSMNTLAAKGGVVFAGDSITEGFPVHEFFSNTRPLYNRGIGGITAAQLLERIEDHVIGLAPNKLFLQIGTNDLGNNSSVEETADCICQICDEVCAAHPGITIYLISLYPVDTAKQSAMTLAGATNRNNENIGLVNNRLADYAKSNAAVVYVNINKVLAGPNGSLQDAYTADGLHLTAEGYMQVVEMLRPFI